MKQNSIAVIRGEGTYLQKPKYFRDGSQSGIRELPCKEATHLPKRILNRSKRWAPASSYAEARASLVKNDIN